MNNDRHDHDDYKPRVYFHFNVGFWPC